MSFGPAAASGAAAGFPQPGATDACPCGSGGSFAACCRAVIRARSAPTAEALMRSRYTAFVVGDARHLRATWHPSTRPESLDLDPGLRWLGLEVVATHAGVDGDARGTVEFIARWRDGTEGGALRERSRFVRQDGAWYYLDGVTG
ncbi:MAG: YchJ family protein [Microbacterium sp.]